MGTALNQSPTPANNKITFISLFIFFASLVLAETILAQHICYIYTSNISFFITAGLFASLAAGSLASLHPFFKKCSLPVLHIINSSCLLISILGFFHGFMIAMGVPWLVISLFGSGIFLTQIFQRFSLRTIIFSSGLGALTFYLSRGFLYEQLQSGIVVLTFILPLIGSLFSTPFSKRIGLVVGLQFTLVAIFLQLGLFQAITKSEKYAPGLRKSQRVQPTHYTPLIVTDLIWAPRQKAYYILTNGTRFSKLITQPSDMDLDKSYLHISYDTPYLVAKPDKVLVIGSGGGANVLTGLKYNPQKLTAVDINAEVFKIANGPLLKENQKFYQDPRVQPVVSEGRNFLEQTQEKFDLIVLQGVQTGTHNSISNPAVLESFLFTKEAVQRMWDLLNPKGMIFFEEYQSLNPEEPETGLSLLGSIANMFLSSFPVTADHLVYFSFPQSLKNPKSMDRPQRIREGLILSKQPLPQAIASLEKVFADSEINFLPAPTGATLKSSIITDNNPFFARPHTTGDILLNCVVVVAILFVVTFFILRKRMPDPNTRQHQQNLLFLGASYMIFVMAIMGPSTLLMGQPQSAIPLVYSSLFFFGSLGGLVALRKSRWILVYGSWAAAAAILVLPMAYGILKPLLLISTSVALRGIVLFCFIGAVAVLLEFPYMAALSSIEKPVERAWGFCLGKLGVLYGMIFGVWLELHFGFFGALICAVSIYALVGVFNFLNLRAIK